MSKRRFRQWISLLVILTLLTGFTGLIIDCVRYPECYISTWRYQLENDIQNGNEQAIEYYKRVYVANGRELFEGGE